MNNLFDKLSLESDLTYVWVYTCTQAGFWSRTLEASWIEVWNLPNLLSTLLKLSKRFVSISSGQSDSCILSSSDQSVFTMEPSLFKAYLYLCAASVSLFCLWIFLWLSEYEAWNNKSKVKGKLGLKMKNDYNGWISLNLKKVRGIFMDNNIQ